MVKVLAFAWDAALQAEATAQAATFGDVVTFDASKLPDDDSATLAAAVAAVATSESVDLVLVGADKRGKDVGPRAAALLDLPFAGEVQSIAHGDGGWTVSRMVLSGNSKATYKMGGRCVVTFNPKTFEATGGNAATVSPGDVAASAVKVTGHLEAAGGDFDLTAAAFVVGVGRGFKAQADIALAQALADKLPNGAVGCSRPVAADLKWLGEEHWIGLSGHEIKPKAYIACGVSGQIQHVAGIRGSKLIVAINTNADAPIFQVSDYGIVGDLYQILPKLTALL